MINLSRVILSPHLNVQSLTVFRSKGSFVAGRWVEQIQSPPSFNLMGIAYPSSEKELAMVPEVDRIRGAMTFLTVEQLYVTHVSPSKGLSDKVQWNDELYKIISLLPWKDYGFYASVGERIAGD
jgi:hypothetical protein